MRIIRVGDNVLDRYVDQGLTDEPQTDLQVSHRKMWERCERGYKLAPLDLRYSFKIFFDSLEYVYTFFTYMPTFECYVVVPTAAQSAVLNSNMLTCHNFSSQILK